MASDPSKSSRPTLTYNPVSACHQFRSLLHRNWLIKWRQKCTFIMELLFPFVFMLSIGRLTLNPTHKEMSVQNETIIAGTLYPNNTIAEVEKATWYIVNNAVFDDQQLRQFSALIQKTHKVICRPKRCNRIHLNATFSSEQDFNAFIAKVPKESSPHLAIILQILNDSEAKYTIRFPYNNVPNDLKTNLCTKRQDHCPSFLYFKTQFSLVQAIMDSAILSFQANKSHLIPNFKIGIFPRQIKQETNMKVAKEISAMVPLSFSCSLPFVIVQLVKEKEHRIKDALVMMGLNPIAYWSSWAAVQGLITVPPAVLWTVFIVYNFQHISPLLLYAIIQLGAYSFTLVAFAISPFFSRSKAAQTVAVIASLVLVGLPYLVITNLGPSSSLFQLLSAISSFPFAVSLDSIFHAESSITFSNLFCTSDFSVGATLIILALDCALYFLCTLALDYLICNGIITDLFNFLMKRAKPSFDEYDLDDSYLQASNVEPITDELRNKKAIEIVNVVKVFDTKVAVKGVSLDLYDSQITCLLGPNAAGKTTLVSILTGELKPTSGQVLIYGHDVQNPSDLRKIRSNFGICLQENIFSQELTPWEQLCFVAEIKGLQDRQAEDEALHMLELMELDKQKDMPSENLSGGQKRKLCVAMAVIANSKIIFLDEPGSGIDVHSRRKIWSVLQALKRDRLILVTTHSMDEADIHSDRKAFLVNGKVHCAGSSLFLKSKFGVGYHLRVDIHSSENGPSIESLICGCIATAKLNRATNSEMIFILPKHEATNFPALFQSLDQPVVRKDLGIRSYGLTVTSLEDVFLAISHQNYATQEHASGSGATQDLEQISTAELKSMEYTSDVCLSVLRRFAAIRFFILLRDSSFLLMFVINATITFGVAFLSTGISEENLLPLALNTKLYSPKILLYNACPAFDAAINLSKYCTPTIVPEFTMKTMQNAIYAIEIAANTSSSFTVDAIFFDVNYAHALPIVQNLASNLLASVWLQRPFQIETISFPLPQSTRPIDVKPLLFSLLMTLFYCSILANFGAEVVEDRVTHVKPFLRACGLRPILYWCPLLLVHGSFLGLTCLVVSALSVFALSLSPLLGDWQLWLCLGTINVFFVTNSLLFCCVFSFLFNSKECAQTAIFYTALLVSFFSLVPFFVLSLIPFCCLGLFTFIAVLVFPFIAPASCFLSLSFLREQSKQADIHYFDWNQALLPNILALITGLVLYSFVLYLVDQVNFCNIWQCFSLLNAQAIEPTDSNNLDPDVQKEKRRVEEFYESIKRVGKAPLLLIRKLTKSFKDKIAVNSLSLTVEKGQVLGLLGSNGAGKTTTVRILIGDEQQTSGDVLVDGKQLEADTDRTALLSHCPQEDPLWNEITLKEHLQLISAIRGVPYHQIDAFCQKLMQMLDIEEHALKRSNCLSGGTKRKLCLLASIIGTAKLVLLDEPSTGMDPRSKRLLWNIIISTFSPNGEKSAILTSHSMEEVEALCTRVAIMMKGTVRCLGTVQHLKNKFGSGYILEISAKPSQKLNCEHIYAYAREHLFPNVMIFDQSSNNIKLEVPQGDIHSLARVFQALQQWLPGYPEIDEYSFCQSSIERVFIRFADKDN